MHYLSPQKQCFLKRREDLQTADPFFFRQFPIDAARWKSCCIGFLFILSVLLIAWTEVQAAQKNIHLQPSSDAAGSALKLTRQTPNSALKKLKNSDMVELPSGKRISMGTLRKFSAISKKLARAPKIRKPLPRSLQYKPQATGIRINSLSDLTATLQKEDSTTIQLPSGRVATVGQIKFLQPLLEKRLGRKLSQFKSQLKYQGTPIRLTASTDKHYWEDILTKPDDTLLESPGGKRFTVGDLKKYMASSVLSRRSRQINRSQGGAK